MRRAVAKVRVYELAKELGIESKVVMAKLNELGEFVRSASSPVEPPVVRKPREIFPAPAEGAAAPAKPARKTAPAPAEPAPAVAEEVPAVKAVPAVAAATATVAPPSA